MQTDTIQPKRDTVILAWVATLLISTLPNILWQEFFRPPNVWLFWSKIILLVILIALSFFWSPAKNLRYYFVLFLVLYAAERLLEGVGTSPLWLRWFPQSSPFIKSMFGIQLRRIAVAAIMIAVLLVIYKHPA